MSDEAIIQWQKATEIKPDFAQAHFSLGNAFYLRGKVPEALAHWRQGLHAEPNHLPVLNQTARVLATCPEASIRNGAEAIDLAARVVRLSGGSDPAILDTMAAAYAEDGRFPEAVQTIRRALALATIQSKQPLAEALKARIGLYEAKTPFRETQPPARMLSSRP